MRQLANARTNPFRFLPDEIRRESDGLEFGAGQPVNQPPLPVRLHAGVMKMDGQNLAAFGEIAQRRHRQQMMAGHD